MSTWPNRGASGGPCGGWKRENPKTQAANLTVRPTQSDSSQQASSKPGAVQSRIVVIQRCPASLSRIVVPHRCPASLSRIVVPHRCPASLRHNVVIQRCQKHK
jgi:hypothetical protein